MSDEYKTIVARLDAAISQAETDRDQCRAKMDSKKYRANDVRHAWEEADQRVKMLCSIREPQT